MLRKPSDPMNFDDWNDYCFHKVIRSQHKARESGYFARDDFFYYNENAIRMRLAYIYTQQWINKYSYGDMVQTAWRVEKIRKRRSDYNPFSLSIQMLFENIDKGTRQRYGHVLKYAYLHEVPAKWLLGFIVQAGGLAQISKKQSQGYRERWRRKNITGKHEEQLNQFVSVSV